MAEYDAFGRRIGENPLEQISGAPAHPVPQAPAEPAPAAPAPAGSGSRVFLIMVASAAVVAAAAIALAVALFEASGGDEERAAEPGQTDEPFLPGAPPEAAPPGGGPSPGEERPAETRPGPRPRGLERGSFLTEPVLARAVRSMRSAELGRPISIRVAADRLDAQLVTSRGQLRMVQVGPDGKLRSQRTVQVGGVPSMPWGAVDPAAPQRLIGAAAEREGRSAEDVDYLVLMPLREPVWGLFFKGGTHYQGDAAGRLLRRVSP